MIGVPVDPDTLHAALRLLLRLTRVYSNAMTFVEIGGHQHLLNLTQVSEQFISVVIRPEKNYLISHHHLTQVTEQFTSVVIRPQKNYLSSLIIMSPHLSSPILSHPFIHSTSGFGVLWIHFPRDAFAASRLGGSFHFAPHYGKGRPVGDCRNWF